MHIIYKCNNLEITEMEARQLVKKGNVIDIVVKNFLGTNLVDFEWFIFNLHKDLKLN